MGRVKYCMCCGTELTTEEEKYTGMCRMCYSGREED